MKIWFDTSPTFTEEHIKLGIGWYKHHSRHKWKGFTVHFHFFKWMLIFNYVNNFKEYDWVVNKRSGGYEAQREAQRKRFEERKKKREQK